MTDSADLRFSEHQATELARLILDELALARLLQHRLHQEFSLLGDASPQALADSAKQKSATLSRLNRQANSRLEWMELQQLPLADAFLQHPTIAARPQLQQLWQQLATQYQTNSNLSGQLSELVLKNRRRIQKRLEILRGQKDRSTILYTSQGTSQLNRSGGGYIEA
ncbi:flagellar export chaperone FlgN [Oceanobacter mangrovi]|uniref:flagellar export chaperone FlgN n=1 Tax=Oceanobacter mangrovi TaxID=2862510 RepID=UPI001C8D4D18|nr:flagellar export chaperone FlgN [Oceanobacter mangrovi]